MAVDIAPFVVVNALGELDNPNAAASLEASSHLVQTSAETAVDERALAEAHASGVTAIHVTVGYTLGDFEPFSHTVAEIEGWDRIIARHSPHLRKVLRADDILAAKSEGRIGIVCGFQNTACLGDELDRVDRFAAMGVRVVQLTYNQANRVGDGAMADENRGLTAFGRAVVERLNHAHLMVDLSHSGEKTCLEAARLSHAPVSINHTGCRALCDLPRNKSDEELRLVASRGGFVGIYFMPFLHPGSHPTAEDVVEHLAHAVNVCGEDHVGIGTDGSISTVDDLEGYRERLAQHMAARRASGAAASGESPGVVPFVADLRGPEQFRRLAELLDRRGFPTGRIEKILGQNFIAYARAIWG